MSEIWFRTGEATVLAAEGQATDAMPEVLIGSVRGPVGQAFASMMGQVQGHTRMFVVRDLNQLVRPATMMTTKATIHTAEYVELLGGAARIGVVHREGEAALLQAELHRATALGRDGGDAVHGLGEIGALDHKHLVVPGRNHALIIREGAVDELGGEHHAVEGQPHLGG